MPYEPFYERFPDVAAEETRTLIVMNDLELPEDDYTLIEAYCNEPDCDCRRVFFNVYSEKKQSVIAVIMYGWESREFYRDWLGTDNPEALDELMGPALNSMSRQSDLAPTLLEKVERVLEDRAYVDRLKRHYRMFKDTVDASGPQQPVQVEDKVGRNDPCPCGSGRKYKHCCGRRG
jgi:hypothetical protein